jgi:hypothetical protein
MVGDGQGQPHHPAAAAARSCVGPGCCCGCNMTWKQLPLGVCSPCSASGGGQMRSVSRCRVEGISSEWASGTGVQRLIHHVVPGSSKVPCCGGHYGRCTSCILQRCLLCAMRTACTEVLPPWIKWALCARHSLMACSLSHGNGPASPFSKYPPPGSQCPKSGLASCRIHGLLHLSWAQLLLGWAHSWTGGCVARVVCHPGVLCSVALITRLPWHVPPKDKQSVGDTHSLAATPPRAFAAWLHPLTPR